MASFAPLQTGQFVVRLRPLRHRRSRALLLAVVLLVGWGCFELGRFVSGYSIAASTATRYRLSQQNESLQQANAKLRRELNAAALGGSVDQQALATLQRSLDELQGQVQKQKAELALYESVLNPTADAGTSPRVQRVDIQPGGAPTQFTLRLVLTRPMTGGGAVQGEALLSVNGMQDGQSLTLPLAQLGGGEALRFSYKYFQTLEQPVTLPAGFEPQSVNVELREGGEALPRQSFGWQVQP